MAGQSDIPADHAGESIGISRIFGTGAGGGVRSQPHQRQIRRGVMDTDLLRQPGLQPLGARRTARGGLVTPLRDGMNLVAKEYVIVAAWSLRFLTAGVSSPRQSRGLGAARSGCWGR